MSYRNHEEITMFNFSNKDYIGLLVEIGSYFTNKHCTGFDDTMIRFDEESQSYVASVYVLDYYEDEERTQ